MFEQIEHLGIWRQCHLKQLIAWRNPFEIELTDSPKNMSECSQYALESLDLHRSVNGTIPESLGRLANLRSLDLSHSRLTVDMIQLEVPCSLALNLLLLLHQSAAASSSTLHKVRIRQRVAPSATKKSTISMKQKVIELQHQHSKAHQYMESINEKLKATEHGEQQICDSWEVVML
ncbi:hypothetical protein L1887_14445 [Cichorium endivia]|nr:hypothetical protein L1887_14445 [Cichorium endivia]